MSKTKTAVSPSPVPPSPAFVTGPGESMIPGDRLGPSIEIQQQSAEYWYWVGVLPSCPREGIILGGINFPKTEETVLINKEQGQTLRIPQAGLLIKLSRKKVELIAFAISRRVFRMTAPVEGRQQCVTLRIPLESEIAEAAKNGLHLRPYRASDSDRPVADFVYMVPIFDEVAPRPRAIETVLPPPVSQTGIALPTEESRKAGSDELTTIAQLVASDKYERLNGVRREGRPGTGAA